LSELEPNPFDVDEVDGTDEAGRVVGESLDELLRPLPVPMLLLAVVVALALALALAPVLALARSTLARGFGAFFAERPVRE
jgi:hypothetical protein